MSNSNRRITDEIKKELVRLLNSECFSYPEQVYVTPRIISPGVFTNPEKYPILSQRKKQIVTRMISDYMKSLGRIKRGSNGHCCWVRKEMVQGVTE